MRAAFFLAAVLVAHHAHAAQIVRGAVGQVVEGRLNLAFELVDQTRPKTILVRSPSAPRFDLMRGFLEYKTENVRLNLGPPAQWEFKGSALVDASEGVIQYRFPLEVRPHVFVEADLNEFIAAGDRTLLMYVPPTAEGFNTIEFNSPNLGVVTRTYPIIDTAPEPASWLLALCGGVFVRRRHA